MKALRLLLALVRWDVVREVRRRECVLNMSLFAFLVLFVGKLGLKPDMLADPAGGVTATVAPVLFWIAILFAGSIGLSQAFAAEREGNAIAGVVTAPVDLGLYYLAKVGAAWLYAAVMEVLLLAAYVVFFDFDPGRRLGALLLVMAAFTLAYAAAGVVLAAMTTTLRGGGEVVLRILLIPLMLPILWTTLRVSERVFGATIAGGALGPPLDLGVYLAFALALDTIYLTAGYILFPKVLEE